MWLNGPVRGNECHRQLWEAAGTHFGQTTLSAVVEAAVVEAAVVAPTTDTATPSSSEKASPSGLAVVCQSPSW
ncbi:hypothetical protein CCHR01_03050 [Colletotrichum chrysophilum]|uniref:Uncharacterized protein n=1 Tax=Colletotrichum chrysophilum TaxID=1836956 RepID=A0AAD9AX75_9PEZI|nr:hypothetical protein CCHR01_03050 [Colletotrichum chrysophilum]